MGGGLVDDSWQKDGISAEKKLKNCGCGCISNVGKYNTEMHAPKTYNVPIRLLVIIIFLIK